MTNENADLTAQKQQKRIIGKPFEKGQSGNPAGRPPGSISITTEIKKKLDEVPDGQKKTYLELLINRILKQAVVDGDVQMLKTIWAYVDGMPRERKDITSEGQGLTPILVEFINGRKDIKKDNAEDNNSEKFGNK